MQKKETVVIGIGNMLMRDEGIGPAIIELMSGSEADYPDVEFIDAGTGGLSLLHIIEGRAKAVIIDCAYMDTEPGTIKRFMPEEVKTQKRLVHQSVHEADIIKVIELADELGQGPDEVVFFGIEPGAVEPGLELSMVLKERLDNYVKAVREELVR